MESRFDLARTYFQEGVHIADMKWRHLDTVSLHFQSPQALYASNLWRQAKAEHDTQRRIHDKLPGLVPKIYGIVAVEIEGRGFCPGLVMEHIEGETIFCALDKMKNDTVGYAALNRHSSEINQRALAAGVMFVDLHRDNLMNCPGGIVRVIDCQDVEFGNFEELLRWKREAE